MKYRKKSGPDWYAIPTSFRDRIRETRTDDGWQLHVDGIPAERLYPDHLAALSARDRLLVRLWTALTHAEREAVRARGWPIHQAWVETSVRRQVARRAARVCDRAA